MTDDWIQILPTPLSVNAAFEFVQHSAAGGVALFVGTTRAETSGSGQSLVALDYEAYEEMALEQMARLAAEARVKWPIVKTVMLHRTGRVGLAEPSVVIAVSTPHRDEAFIACRWLIDELKAQVTIWKKEVWADGATTWVG